MELDFYEPVHEIQKPTSEIQALIDTSFPTIIREKVIAKKLDNVLIVKSEKPELDNTLDLKPENFLGKGLSGLVLSGQTEKGQVAYKLFTTEKSVNSATTDAEFASEKEILEGIHHPNIADYLGEAEIKLTESTTIKVLVREFIPLKFHRLNVGEAVQMAYGITNGLNYLYEKKGALMPDLGPNNIRQKTDGEWVIVDAGYMAIPKDNRPRIIFTDDKFTAPEVEHANKEDRNQVTTPASEVYSLALLAWFGLSGVENDPLQISSLFALEDEFPKAIIDVLKKATADNPKNRYQTPTEFADALKDASFQTPKPTKFVEDDEISLNPEPITVIEDTHEPGESRISPILKDFSGKPEAYVRKRIKNLLKYAKSIVVFPDLGPTDERLGLAPTGSSLEVDTLEHKDWLKLLGGSDMGCGIVFANLETPISSEDAQKKLDEINEKIASGELWLGGGNHFIDFMKDSTGKDFVAIHTGAPRDEQEELNQIVEQTKIDGNWEEATALYLEKYQAIIKSASENRQKIISAISEVYGKCEVLYHEPHNTIDINADEHTATIYKGVVHVTDLNKRQFLPSSMNEGAAFFLPGPSVGEKTHWGMAHGTGKARSTHDQRDQEDLNIHPDIMLPTSANGTVSRGVAEGAYNSYPKTEVIMLNNGLMKYDDPDDIRLYKTVAHINR